MNTATSPVEPQAPAPASASVQVSAPPVAGAPGAAPPEGSPDASANASERRRRPDDRPREILSAALEVFAEQGVGAARLDDIARRAGVSKGTIYLYYADKDALFRACVRATIHEQLDTAERAAAAAAAQAGDPATQLHTYMRAWWRLFTSRHYRVVLRLYHAEMRDFGDLVAYYHDAVVHRAWERLADILSSGMVAGVFRQADPRAIVRNIVALAYAHSAWRANDFIPAHRLLPVGPDADDEAFDQSFEFIRHAIMASGA